MRIHLNFSFYPGLLQQIISYARGSKVLNALDSFLVPNLCFGCKVQLYRGENILCAFCRNEMPLTEQIMNDGSSISGKLSDYSPDIQVFALCFFEPHGIMQKLIHQLKYKGKQSIGAWLGTWCGNELLKQPNLQQFDWVLPVPLHARRQRKRGYNQCTHFGKKIAKCLGANYTEKILVRKVFQTTQTTKNKASRLANINGAFEVVNPIVFKDKNVLLVDDVITTGATLTACCEALSQVPGIRVSIAAMAVVP